ncbi:MAG: type 4a pilus biogenesis protein PilO [Gammaproteobacteria bacterium]
MNLNELTLDNIGTWPIAARISVIGFVCAIIFALFFLFDVRPMRLKIAQTISNEDDLRTSYQVKYSQIVNRDAYVQQVDVLRNNIKNILAELPDQLDVPELIGDISKIGSQAGLEFNFIKPQAEIKHSYYTALPVNISVNGTYAQLTNFITALAKIPRIVTIDDFSIEHYTPPNNNTDTTAMQNNLLTMELTAVTYKQNSKKKTLQPADDSQ